MLSVSRWFVGSSSSSTSGAESRSAAMATRIFHPPEKSAQFFTPSSRRKPRPCSTFKAMDSKAKPPDSSKRRSSRACSSRREESSTEPDAASDRRASVSRRRASIAAMPARSLRKSISGTGSSSTRSCGRQPTVSPLERSTVPPSGTTSPIRTRRSVVLPEPLLPTTPSRASSPTRQLTPSKITFSPKASLSPLMSIRTASLHGARRAARPLCAARGTPVPNFPPNASVPSRLKVYTINAQTAKAANALNFGGRFSAKNDY